MEFLTFNVACSSTRFIAHPDSSRGSVREQTSGQCAYKKKCPRNLVFQNATTRWEIAVTALSPVRRYDNARQSMTSVKTWTFYSYQWHLMALLCFHALNFTSTNHIQPDATRPIPTQSWLPIPRRASLAFCSPSNGPVRGRVPSAPFPLAPVASL